jgi:hypothetical protein
MKNGGRMATKQKAVSRLLEILNRLRKGSADDGIEDLVNVFFNHHLN